MKKILSYAFILTMIFALASCTGDEGPMGEQGLQGDQGPQGEQGIPGNANVSKYFITIANTDWDGNAHFGGNNTHTYFEIPTTMTGGIHIGNLNYVPIAFGRPAGTDYTEKKGLPYVFGVNNNYGLRFELLPSRREVIMSKTTNGWDSAGVPMSERPTSFELEIFMVEVSAANRAENEINMNNYEEVVNYFK